MTKRTILVLAIALAGCKKDSAKDPGAGSATGTGSAKGTGTGTGTAVAAIDATPAPLVVQIPEAMPTSTQAVVLEPNLKVFVTVDGIGALAIGAVPADRKGAWPTPQSVPDLAALVEAAKAMNAPTAPADQPPPPPPSDAGLFATVRVGATPASDEVYAGLGNTPPAPAIAAADRTITTGVVSRVGDDLTTIVLADRAGEARALIPVLAALGNVALGVQDATGAVARSAVRFGLEFAPDFRPGDTELLVDVTADAVTVRSGPGPTHGTAAWTGAQIDVAALGAAVKAASVDAAEVHLSIGEATSVSRLVSVVDALVDAGVQTLVIRNWTRPELHGPVVTLGGEEVVDGALDAGAIRPAVTGIGAALKQCYVDALAADPAVAGTLDVAVILAPGATVKDVILRGLDAVSACTKTALGGLAFTHADGGEVAIHFVLRYRNLP